MRAWGFCVEVSRIAPALHLDAGVGPPLNWDIAHKPPVFHPLFHPFARVGLFPIQVREEYPSITEKSRWRCDAKFGRYGSHRLITRHRRRPSDIFTLAKQSSRAFTFYSSQSRNNNLRFSLFSHEFYLDGRASLHHYQITRSHWITLKRRRSDSTLSKDVAALD